MAPGRRIAAKCAGLRGAVTSLLLKICECSLLDMCRVKNIQKIYPLLYSSAVTG